MAFPGKKALIPGLVAGVIAGIGLTVPLQSASAASITVTATIRDFSSSHADFQQGIIGSESGIVLSALGADGNPVYNTALKGPTGAASATTKTAFGTAS